MIVIFHKEAIGGEFHRSCSHKVAFCFLVILVQGNYYLEIRFVTPCTCTTRLVTRSTRLTARSICSTR